MRRLIANRGWTLGLAGLLVLLLIVTRLIQPDFGVSGLDSVARAALPFALATVGMVIVVIAGGIDLSIAAMMAVASVTAAVLMSGQNDGASAHEYSAPPEWVTACGVTSNREMNSFTPPLYPTTESRDISARAVCPAAM